MVCILPTWREEQEPLSLYLYMYPFPENYLCLP